MRRPRRAVLAGAALATGLLIAEPAAAIAAFALLGLGLGPIVPLSFRAAGRLDAAHRGRMISCVAAIGYVGSVSGPLVIGGLAGAVGLPAALVVPAALSILIALAADALSPRVGDPDGCSLRITMNTVAVALASGPAASPGPSRVAER